MKLSMCLLGLILSAAFTKAEAAGPVIEDHPCIRLESDCKLAGYKKDDHKEKNGLYKDCMEPLMDGKMPARVKVSPADVAACKAKRDAQHK